MTNRQKRILVAVGILSFAASIAFNRVASGQGSLVRFDNGFSLASKNELAPIVELAGNETSEDRVKLGMSLFFDTDLSSDRRISCAVCHLPERAFTDGRAVAVGVRGQVGRRNPPTVLNACYKRRLFWDGRAGPYLESQPGFPLLAGGEHGMTIAGIEAYLKAQPEYIEMFRAAYDEAPSFIGVVKALSCFMRELVSFNAPIDKWLAGETWELKEQQKLGLAVFINCTENTGYNDKKKLELVSSAKGVEMFRKGYAGSCTTCHNGQDYNCDLDGMVRPHNVGAGENDVDLGVQILTDDQVGQRATPETDAYVTPTLREHQLTNPYGHRGQWATTEDVIAFKERGGDRTRFLSGLVRSYKWTPKERAELAIFLKTAFAGDFKERIAELGIKVKE